MKRIQIILLLMLSFQMMTAQRYEANWESLNKRGIPKWFNQDKFGIFIHWGVYAVPSFAPVIPNSGLSYSEWYWNQLSKNQQDFKTFHEKSFGADFTYPQFESRFKAEMFNPQQWAQVFKNSGAKYIVLTSKHHEGYCLWNSAESDRDWQRPWNAVTGTPHRDLLGDLTKAVRTAGLKMGYYYSLYEWFNPLWLNDRKRYVTEHMIPQFKDLVIKYKPSVIFSDGEWDLSDTAWQSPALLAWLFNESPVAKDVVVNDRWGSNTRGKNTGSTYSTSEYGSGMSADVTWEESRGIGHSYGYNRNEKLEDYKTSHDLILILIDVVARGGNLLLDIGPTADGRIPVIMQQRLTDMGNWLKINGEAIYQTKAWSHSYQWSQGKAPVKKNAAFMSGYDVAEMVKPTSVHSYIEYFFTRKEKDLYCIVPAYLPSVRIKDFKPKAGAAASILGSKKAVTIKASGNDCVIDLSRLQPGDVPAELFVVKIKNGL